jgi:hypothetical protein
VELAEAGCPQGGRRMPGNLEPGHKIQSSFEISDYVAKVWEVFGSPWF